MVQERRTGPHRTGQDENQDGATFHTSGILCSISRFFKRHKLLPPFQWSMFKINELETLDTAFYRCEASNAAESVHSDAIVQVSQILQINVKKL